MSSQGFFGSREEKSGGVVPEWMRDPSKFGRQLAMAVLALLLLRLLIYFLVEFESIFQPLLVALMICYVIMPLHHMLVQWKIPSKLAFILILILIIGICYGLGWIIYQNIVEVEERWHIYQKNFVTLAQNLINTVTSWFPSAEPAAVRDLIKFPSQNKIVDQMNAWVGSFFSFFLWLLVVIVYIVFLVTEQSSFPKRVNKAFGETKSEKVTGVVQEINAAIAKYLSAKTLISIFTGLLTVIVLLIFRVDFVVTWGIITFLFNFIPYIGSIIAGAFPVLLCFVQYPDQLWRGGVVAVLLFAIQQVIGNVVEPKYLGKKLHLSPLLILVALSFWGIIWGIVGMILAVPMLVVIQIIFSSIRETRPLATLMSNE